jgi:hypothetical protein
MDEEEITEAQNWLFREVGFYIFNFYKYYGKSWVEENYHLDLEHIPFDKESIDEKYKNGVKRKYSNMDGYTYDDPYGDIVAAEERWLDGDGGLTTEPGYITIELLEYIKNQDNIEPVMNQLYGAVAKYFLGISAEEVEAALYRDTYEVYTYDNLYQLTTMSKSEWVDFVLNKYDLTNVKGAKEYVDNRYDHYIKVAKNDTYKGKTSFYNSYEAWLTAGDLTESQLQDIYIYFCRQEYDSEYTQALMNHFNCTEEQVYLEHSDILREIGNNTGKFADIAISLQTISNNYNISLNSIIEMFVKTKTSYSLEDKEYTRQYFYNYFGIE